MSAIEYFFNDAFSINANASLYATNTTPFYNNAYDYIITFPGRLADFFSVKNYQQDGATVIYVPIDPSITSYMGSNQIGATNMGSDVCISKDGLTMAVGGRADDNYKGAVWIWTRNGINWVQQAKLIGTNGTGPSQQGMSVSLSNDGNILAVGGPKDNEGNGAVWIWTRTDNIWSQEQIIISNDYVGSSNFGCDVALSGTGNMVVVGGRYDNSNNGAVWVFTRSNNTWSKQQKISDNSGTGANQGTSVSVSEDGTTLVYGGPADSSNSGAVWVYRISSGVWSQETKIIGKDMQGINTVSGAFQGKSVQISKDGTTIAFGGPTYNTNKGAVWIWTYSSSTWSQQIMISNTDYNILGINPYQGYSVTLSANGDRLVFGTNNNTGTGSIWVYSRTGSSWIENDWLIYNGNYGDSRESITISMSGDGMILTVSAPNDNMYKGAVWSYINSGSSLKGNGSTDSLTNDVIVSLTFNTDYYNGTSTSGFNNVNIAGGRSDVKTLGMNGLEQELDFNTRILEILAVKIFGHARARAAISNDTDIIAPIKQNLSNHIINVINTHKYDIFNQYVQTDNPNLNANDINVPVEFNFNNDSLVFPGFIAGSLLDGSNLSAALLQGPSVGGNIIDNGNYNIPILIRLGN